MGEYRPSQHEMRGANSSAGIGMSGYGLNRVLELAIVQVHGTIQTYRCDTAAVSNSIAVHGHSRATKLP